MDEQERDIQLIDRFLLKELSDEEALEVQKRLDAEPGFRALHDDLIELKKGMKSFGQKNLKEKLAAWDKAFDNPLEQEGGTEVKIIPWRTYIGWAAVLVVGFFSIFTWYSSDTQQANRIYNKHFEMFDNVIEPTRRGNDQESTESQAFTFYDLGAYDEARPLFESLAKNNDSSYLRFYQGMVYMALENWELAENALSRSGDDFKEQATWYRALVALKQKDFDRAEAFFVEVSMADNSYSSDAREILKKLD